MSLIGILTEHKHETYLKKKLEEKGLQNLFFLNEKTIENMHNIKFDTFLLGKKIENKQHTIRHIAEKSKYCILNSDIKENLPILENLNLTLITYGYNQKATITASSIEENKIIICLQRNIKNIYGEEIEAGEFEVEVLEEIQDEAVMEFASLNLLYSCHNK